MGRAPVVILIFVSLLLYQNCSGVGVEFSHSELRSCVELEAEEMAPQLKWSWLDQLDMPNEAYPDSIQVMSSPMVGDLNGDGRPEVVFVTFTGNQYTSRGVLRVVDGATGKTNFSVGQEDLAPSGSMSPLLVDIDGDGRSEILYIHYAQSSLVALNHNGSLRWSLNLPGLSRTSKGLAATDLDGDGRAEILVGKYVVGESTTRTPSVQFQLQGEESVGNQFALSLDASLPYDMQIVGRTGVYSADGQKLYPLDPLGYAAAQIHGSSGMKLVGTGEGRLKIYDAQTGLEEKSVDLTQYNELLCPKGVGGGPPTLGDFDGDPKTVEIAMATGRYLIIMDAEGRLRAKYETQDCSSRATGVSSFDFNGDGKPEILYGDEEYFRIFEMRDEGLHLIWSTPNPSGTLNEYPVVADIDNDGASELLVVANNYPAAGFYKDPGEEGDYEIAQNITGVRAFGSAKKFSWMPTRRLWNQFDYNPAFVTDRLRAVAKTPIQESFTSRLFRRNAQLGEFENGCR